MDTADGLFWSHFSFAVDTDCPKYAVGTKTSTLSGSICASVRTGL